MPNPPRTGTVLTTSGVLNIGLERKCGKPDMRQKRFLKPNQTFGRSLGAGNVKPFELCPFDAILGEERGNPVTRSW